MQAIIIDDEKRARHLLTTLIRDHINELHVVTEASNLKDGVTAIKELKPDIVFLDIEMPGETGLEIMNYFKDDEIAFQIIFVTAYNQYAVDAFRMNAIDYLLKPIDIDELKSAFAKAKQQQSSQQISEQIERLRQSVQQLSMDKIVMEIPRGYLFTSHNDIIYLEADGMYTNVYMINGKRNVICKPLKHFVEQLEGNKLFFKCHRSYMINLKHISELVKHDGDYIVMDDKKQIPISRSKRDQFLTAIQETFL